MASQGRSDSQGDFLRWAVRSAGTGPAASTERTLAGKRAGRFNRQSRTEGGLSGDCINSLRLYRALGQAVAHLLGYSAETALGVKRGSPATT